MMKIRKLLESVVKLLVS